MHGEQLPELAVVVTSTEDDVADPAEGPRPPSRGVH
jgi:hypothetical protein